MTLREKQSLFVHLIGKLISFAYENGFELTFGEGQRTADQQLLYFEGYKLIKTGSVLHLAHTARKSKTLKSKHIEKLAHDFNVFKNGKYLTAKKDVQPLGDFWESLHERAEWGGNWKTFIDVPHFHLF